MKKKNEPTVVVEESPVSYRTALDIYYYFGIIKCKIESPNDITLVTSRQAMLERIVKNYKNKVLDTPIPQDATEDQIQEIRAAQAEIILNDNCGLKKEDVEFFTFDQLLYGLQNIELTNREIGFLSFWLVKPEA